MDSYENEEMMHQEPQPEAVQPAPDPIQPEPQPQQGFYHGAGAGQKESPFANSPYVTYHVYQPPYQQGWQPTYQQPTQPQPEPKKEKKGRKVLKTIVAAILVIALVAAGCGVTAALCNQYWREQNALLKQNLEDKLTALQQQISAGSNSSGGSSGGTLVSPGETMTAAQIYQQNVNSVVAITCTIRTSSNGQVYESTSAGTGFIITEDGYVVTNHHVIEGASKITVTLADGTQYVAAMIGSDATNDVALVKMEAHGLDPVTIGSSSAMQVGDQVIAIGNALGKLTSSLTVGYVSGIDRDVTTDGAAINMIQTDVAINSGNSGGPLFNARGEVIGITTAKYSGTTSSGASIEGISFAIPIDDVLDMLDDLREFGYVKSAYLGVYVSEMDPSVAAAYNLPLGVYVQEVTPGYCAEKAGLRAKDIILELGGYQVEGLNDLSRALRAYEAGETVTMVVWRSGQELILQITLDEKPQS